MLAVPACAWAAWRPFGPRAGVLAAALAACVPLALFLRAFAYAPPLAVLAGAGSAYALAAFALDVAGVRTGALAALRR